MFKGIHNINLDGKGRLTIPTKYRNTISDQSNGNMVVTIDSEEKCLLLYPATIFSNIESKINYDVLIIGITITVVIIGIIIFLKKRF